jgi:ligand-binding sensor domain-containing protein/serine phosphatase RsbU (regulator of sigma subunit)
MHFPFQPVKSFFSRCIFFSILLGGLLAAVACSAQTYNFKNYSVEEGLAQSQILSVFQARDGLMWFGTNSGGACSFDGIKFNTVSEKKGLLNNVIYSICDDREGNIVFGTLNGLSIYNGFKFHNFTDSSGLPHKRVYKVLRDKKDVIWVGTAKGVCQLRDNKIIPFKSNQLLNTSSVFAIYADSKDRIWFGTMTNGVFVYDGKSFIQYSEKEGLSNNFIRGLQEDKEGRMWVATNNGLNRIADGKIEHDFKINSSTDQAKFQTSYVGAAADLNGNLWFASAAGAYKYDGRNFTRYTEQNGMAASNLLCVLCDREGSMWFGTSGSGVSRLSREAFFNLSSSDSLPRDYVSAVYMDSKNEMWVAMQDAGVIKLNDRYRPALTYKPDLKRTDKGIIGMNILCIQENKDGRMWFGTGSGLSISDGHTFLNYTVKDGLKDNKIYAISKEVDGKIWIGTKSGICYHRMSDGYHPKEGFAVDFPRLNSLLDKDSRAIQCIFTDRKGNTWFGTEKGAMMMDKSVVHVFSKKAHFTDKKVSCILEDDQGNIWFGTGEGVFLYDGKEFFRIDENNGLTSNKIYLLIFDNSGFLWVGTNKGLDRLDATQFRKSRIVSVKHYGKEEGFKGVECNINSCCKDNKERIWFGTIKGVTVYDHKLDKDNTVEPLTEVSKIRLFFQDVDFSPWSKGIDSATKLPSNLILPYTKNHLTFDFRGVSLMVPSKVKYTFLLEGVDRDWVPPTSKNEATYSSIPAGEYTFLLKACNNDGLWNKEPFVYHFVILPPWYKTWWFYTLCILLIVSGVYLFIKIRTRQLMKTQITLETQVRERTHELREEKEKVELVNKEISAQKSIIETKNRDITDSIQYAKNIQEAILPQLDIISQEFPQSFILYMPKDIVSGDFYWFAKRKNKKFIATADCTGHGVPGAFMSIIGNTILNEIVSDKEILEPGEILNELHAGIKNALKQSNAEGERRDGMDIALCAMEENSNVLEYAGANRPIWIFRGGRADAMEVIKPDKAPIGGLETEDKRRFTNNRIELGKGDRVYLSTDGYADQFGGHAGKKMMVKNFHKLLSEIIHLPFPEQKEILRKHFLGWKGDQEQVDDVLVIGFGF